MHVVDRVFLLYKAIPTRMRASRVSVEVDWIVADEALDAAGDHSIVYTVFISVPI